MRSGPGRVGRGSGSESQGDGDMVEMKEKRKFNFVTLGLLAVVIILGALIYFGVV
jgi:hypothetical protein